ncbi:MAG TPA: glycosyltransferase, partial [Ignavibacteria bacterium]|nr:glycosyltransferase [Ignavibacteria bacterium]
VFEAHTKPSRAARFVARRAHKVVVISRALKEEYVDAGVSEEKIIVAPDAVDIRQFDIDKNKTELREQLGLEKDKKIISYIGKYKTMGKPKGVDDLSIVFPQVLTSVQNAFLLLVGINKEEVSEVEETLHKAHIIESNYKIVTHIPQHEAFLYMKASDVLIMNYPNTPHYALYMSPLKLFEYMASGTPIVTSDLSTIREVLNEQDTTFFTPDSTPALAESILFALTHEREVQEKAHHAKQKAAGYTWEKRAERILATLPHYE